MTITQRVKRLIIDVLTAEVPDESISVVDAKQREEYALPCLSVDVSGVANYSDDLPQVQRVTMDVSLAVHSGDDEETEIEDWIAVIERTLDSVADVSKDYSDGITIYSWIYGGSSQEWDSNIMTTKFSVECLASRI